MKKIILSFSLLTTLSLSAQQQIGNSNFEAWDNLASTNEEPSNWNSFMTANCTLGILICPFGQVKKIERISTTRPGSTGSYSVRIWSTSAVGVVANGNMTLGKINMGSTTASNANNHNYSVTTDANFSEAFTDTPDSLVFWVKATLAGTTEEARVSAVIHNNTNGYKDPNDVAGANTIAKAILNFPKTNGAWVRKSIPFTWIGSPANAAYMIITFTTNKTPGGGAVNDELLIDDLELIYNKPVASFTTGLSNICAGSSVSFTNNTTTYNHNTTYAWSVTGPATLTSSVASPSFTFNTPGTYDVTLTATNAYGNNVSTQTGAIVVNALPSVTTTDATLTVCPGTSVNLGASGASTYSWTPGSLSGASQSVTPASNTTYTVTGTNAAGCTNSATTVVNLHTVTPATITPSTNATVCPGTNVDLTANNGTTYSWSTSATTANISVLPSSTASYSVTATDANGCTSTANHTVNVTPINVVLDGTAATICPGGSSVLSATGADNYSWSTTETSTSITVSPATTTTYSVTGTTGTCTQTKNYTVTVGTGITVAFNMPDTAVCNGNSISITASGADTYTWMPGNLTGATVSVSPSALTTYTVTGTSGSCTDVNTINVGVDSPITVSITENDFAICTGASSTVNVTGGTTYTWMPGNLTGASITVNPTSDTQYTVTGKSGTCSSQDVINVTVNALPSITFNNLGTVCNYSAPFTLNTATPAGGNYSGTGVTSNTFNPSGIANGTNVTITYAYTDNNSCSNTATATINVSDCAGIDENVMEKLTVYPNPSEGIFTISSIENVNSIEVLNTAGQIIQNVSNQTQIDLSNQKNGVYFLKIKGETFEQILKVIKK